MSKEKKKEKKQVPPSQEKVPFYMQEEYVKKTFILQLNGNDLNVLRKAIVSLVKTEPDVTCYGNLTVFGRIQYLLDSAEEKEGGKENED